MKTIIALSGLALLFMSGCNITIEPPKGNMQVSQNGNSITISQGNSNKRAANNATKPTPEKPKEVAENREPKEDNSNKDYRDVKVQVPRLNGEIPKNLKICVHVDLGSAGSGGSPCYTPDQWSKEFSETPPFDKEKGIITIRADRDLLGMEVWCVIEEEEQNYFTENVIIKGKDTKTSYILGDWGKSE